MPSPSAIIAGLRFASVHLIPLAITWHVLLLAALILLIRGSRPSRRIGATLLALPIVSASAVAFAVGNPFNGALLGATGAVLIVLAWQLDATPWQLGSTPARALGAAMIVFAWIYPHFLEGLPPRTYLWAAPVGVIPCPTLSLVIGFALFFDGVGSRSWSLVLAAVGLFYGIFGAARLGVALDVLLVGGAAALLARTLLRLRGQGPREVAAHQPSG